MAFKKFSQADFNQFIIDQDILGFFAAPIKLVSGRTSSWYINWRNALYDAVLLDKVSDYVLAFLQSKNISGTCFYGIPDGTTKLAIIAQYKFIQSLPKAALKPGKYFFSMARKTPKDHGDPKDRFFVGQPTGKVIVIEDVTTTGESVLKHVQVLRNFGVEVVAAITLSNRNEVRDNQKSIAEELAGIGVPYFAMSNALDLLPKMVSKKKPNAAIVASVIKEFQIYGEQEINLEEEN